MNAQLLPRGTTELPASCFPYLGNSLGNTKRYAMYIPQSFFENARKALAQVDAKSTWEFSALTSPSKSISSESTSSPPNTPAQEIVIRYRAGMPLCFEGDGPQSDIFIDDGSNADDDSPAIFHSPVEYPECRSDDTLMVGFTKTEIKFPHGQPCLGLSETLKKRAHSAPQSRGFREANTMACPSPNVLRTMVDRTFQPRTHDMQEGRRMRSKCSASPKSHENRQGLQGSGPSFMGFCFRSMFMNILSKLSRHK